MKHFVMYFELLFLISVIHRPEITGLGVSPLPYDFFPMLNSDLIFQTFFSVFIWIVGLQIVAVLLGLYTPFLVFLHSFSDGIFYSMYAYDLCIFILLVNSCLSCSLLTYMYFTNNTNI